MDQEWTKSIESALLNTPKLAEGVGFEVHSATSKTELSSAPSRKRSADGFESQ